MNREELLNRVRTFNNKVGMAPRTFGKLALNDENFVYKLLKPDFKPTYRQWQACVDFMKTYGVE